MFLGQIFSGWLHCKERLGSVAHVKGSSLDGPDEYRDVIEVGY